MSNFLVFVGLILLPKASSILCRFKYAPSYDRSGAQTSKTNLIEMLKLALAARKSNK